MVIMIGVILVLAAIAGCGVIDRRLDRRYACLIAADRARWAVMMAEHQARQEARQAFAASEAYCAAVAWVARATIRDMIDERRQRLCRPGN